MRLKRRCRSDKCLKIGSFYHQIFILSQSDSVQNLSSLTLRTKKLERGQKHSPPSPPPPGATLDQKPSAYRVKHAPGNRTMSQCKLFHK